MEAVASENQNRRDLNLKIQEEILRYFNGPRQNYILTPDKIAINDEFQAYFNLPKYKKLDSNEAIKDARLIEHIANIFSKIRNINVSESTEQSWTNESSISYETFKCLIVYLINLSHNENYSIRNNIFLAIFEDLINYNLEKETNETNETTFDSVVIILLWFVTIGAKLFEKYKELDFKSYKDCSQVGKLAIIYFKRLLELHKWYSHYTKHYEYRCGNEERGIYNLLYIFLTSNISENIERICEKNVLLYIELENLLSTESFSRTHFTKGFTKKNLSKKKFAYSFYKQTMDILSNKNLKNIKIISQYKYSFISELWYPEVILKAIEDYYQKSEPEDFETSLEGFLELCPTFELLCQNEFKELFPQSKDLTGVFKEIKENSICNDKPCIYKDRYWCIETLLTADIIHKTYNNICLNHKTSSINIISLNLPDDSRRQLKLFNDIKRLLNKVYVEQRERESMTNEECKALIEGIFREGKKYNSQEGELLHFLLYYDWDNSLIKDYHKEICDVFEYYTNSMMKTELLVAYYCVLRKIVPTANLNVLTELMKLRWEAEKNFMRFLLKSATALPGEEIDFSKINRDIEKFPFVFFLAFLKIFLFFSRQDFSSRKILIKQEKCIDIFVKTLEHFPSLKKILFNTEELYWFPTLDRGSLLNLSEAIFQLIKVYEKNFPYEKLELVFKGYWGGVLTIKEKLRIEHCEKSSLREIKILGEGGFALAQLVKTKKSPIPQVAKYFKATILSENIRNEVITLLSLQGNQHVVALYGFITENYNLVGLLMEYCEGGSFEKKIESPDDYSEKEITLWTTQAAAGLVFLHENKIIHRDIKPANLLLDKNHRILKVADVGISKPSISPDFKHNMRDTSFYGTPGYAAPEAETRRATSLVDVYSLGRTIWHMIYRNIPNNDKVENSIANPNNNKTTFPRTVTVSSELMDFHIRMMEDEVEKRPKMQEVYDFFSAKIDEIPE